MKKFTVFLIAVLFTFLSACSGENENKNKLFDIDYKSYVYDTFEVKTEKEVYTADDTTIKYTIKNISKEDGFINSDSGCFDLQVKKDGKWMSVGTKIDHYWTEVALLLPPDSIEKREINLEDFYYLPLDEGTYRICIEGILSETFEIKH